MIEFTPGKEFLAAVPHRYKPQDPIEARGLRGRVIEPISRQDYLEVWAYRGFDSEAIAADPRFYYRCQLISDKPPLTTEPASELALPGGEESA